jgi:predicted TIM-barrel fold metal-dependent hydrolase
LVFAGQLIITMKKIDAHFHVNFSNFDAGHIIQYLNQNNIEKCWLLTWEELDTPIPSIYQHLSVEDLFEAYNQYPDRIIPFYAPDPKSAAITAEIERYLKAGLKGCGELKVTHLWKEEIIEEYLKKISNYSLPVVFHMEAPRMHYVQKEKNQFEHLLSHLMNGAFNGVSGYYLQTLAEKTSILKNHLRTHSEFFPGYLFDFEFLEKRLIQFPNLIFIGHGPHFWNNISTELSLKYVHQKGKIKEFGIIDQLLEKYSNLYCDISGRSGYNALKRDIIQSRVFLEKHADKILFGTDNTNYHLEQFLLSFKLPQEKLKRIFYENANTIVGV